MKKKATWLLLAAVISLSLFGCSSEKTSSASEKKELKIGFTPGPYSDQVRKAIEPQLKKKGYTVKYVEFNDITQPNFALGDRDLDANVFQHTAYFDNFRKENKLDLTEVIKVPTAPFGIYSDRHKSLDELKDGDKIAIPNDPPNIARALRLLEVAGWVKLKEGYDPITVSKRDIVEQKAKFSFIEVEQAQLARTLEDVDYALVTGNFILASDRSLSSSLKLEDPPFEYQNLVAVRTEDKDKTFVKDIIAAYKAPEFQEKIESDKDFEGFHKPDYFK